MLGMTVEKSGQERSIGQIEGKLDLLIEDMKADSKKRDEQDDRLERIERSQDVLGRRIDDVLKRLEGVEKPVAEFNRWRERAIGAMMFVSLAAALIGGAVATYWHKILSAFK